ncbi:MAG: radical SAM protein [Gaiellales bacterium]|nr:MAG: radical SAM protein [Gaiellales bacterium]
MKDQEDKRIIDRTPIGSMKILSCYREIQRILQGNMPVPRTLEFFLSNDCNHFCPGCHSLELHKGEERFLDFDAMKRTVIDASKLGVAGIEISGGGEPLMYPEIVPAIALMRSRGLKVGMFSNGTMIDEELAPFLVDNLLFLRLAFDAATRETYKMRHGVDQFDRLLDAIGLLVKAKRERVARAGGAASEVATIGAKFLVSSRNYGELTKAASLAKELGFDYLQYKPLRNSKFTPKGEDLKNAREEAARAEGLGSNGFEVFGSLRKTRVIGRCFLNPLHPLIDATGSVYLCAFFQHRQETHRIGNINEKSFPEIWYSERHFEAFRSTDPAQCAIFDCPFHDAAILAKEWIVDNRKHLEFI